MAEKAGKLQYEFDARPETGEAIDIAPGLAIPVVAGLVWYGVRRVRRYVARQSEGQG